MMWSNALVMIKGAPVNIRYEVLPFRTQNSMVDRFAHRTCFVLDGKALLIKKEKSVDEPELVEENKVISVVYKQGSAEPYEVIARQVDGGEIVSDPYKGHILGVLGFALFLFALLAYRASDTGVFSWQVIVPAVLIIAGAVYLIRDYVLIRRSHALLRRAEPVVRG